LTARDLGALGLKLMGAFFAASATIRLLALVTAMAALPVVNGLDARTLFRVNGFGFLAELAIASVLVIKAESLAERLFPGHPVEIAGLSRRDLLIGGIALLGVSTVIGAAPGILRFVGQAIWLAQGTRQAEFVPTMERSWESLSNSVLELIVGGALLAKAGTLGSVLDRRYRPDEKSKVEERLG
jgi:hypothetical protein